MPRRLALLTAAIFASLLCAPALAELPKHQTQETFDDDWDLDLHLSSFGPYGGLGASVAYAPVDYFAVEFGGGVALFSGFDATIAGQLRAPIWLERYHLLTPYLAVGASYTPFFHDPSGICTLSEGECPDERTSDHVLWANVELGFQLEFDDQRRFGFHLGASALLGAASTTVFPDDGGDPYKTKAPDFLYPYAGARLGFDLPL